MKMKREDGGVLESGGEGVGKGGVSIKRHGEGELN